MTAESGDLIWAEAVTHHAGDDPELLMDPRIERIFRDIPESERYPGVHLMTGPIYLRDENPEISWKFVISRCFLDLTTGLMSPPIGDIYIKNSIKPSE